MFTQLALNMYIERKNIMAEIIFYTKPQCKNAVKQLELLELAGHSVKLVDLIAHQWSENEILRFFGNFEAHDWFNTKHPKVKDGTINPQDYNKEEAMKMLLEDHLLIRRPIIVYNNQFQIGFDKDNIEGWIGLKPIDVSKENLFRVDVTTCKQPSGQC